MYKALHFLERQSHQPAAEEPKIILGDAESSDHSLQLTMNNTRTLEMCVPPATGTGTDETLALQRRSCQPIPSVGLKENSSSENLKSPHLDNMNSSLVYIERQQYNGIYCCGSLDTAHRLIYLERRICLFFRNIFLVLRKVFYGGLRQPFVFQRYAKKSIGD